MQVLAADATGSEWQSRQAAFNAAVKNGVPRQADQQLALVDLLRQENTLVENILAQTGGRQGVSAVLGEGYAEYYARLFDAVLSFSKSGLTQAYPVLAAGAYDARSSAAEQLIRRADLLVPVLIKKANAPVALSRAQAVDMLGMVLAQQPNVLSESQVSQLTQTIASALDDKSIVVKRRAIQAVSEARLKLLAPKLQSIAGGQDGSGARAPLTGDESALRNDARQALESLER